MVSAREWLNSRCANMKFSIKDFFSECDQIRRKLRMGSHKLKKSLMENFLCSVNTSVITGNVKFRLHNALADYKEAIVINCHLQKSYIEIEKLMKIPWKITGRGVTQFQMIL